MSFLIRSTAAITPPEEPPARIASLMTSQRQPVTHSRSLTCTHSSMSVRSQAGSQPWNHPLGLDVAEDQAAERIDRDHPGLQAMVSDVLAAATNRAAGARGDEQIVDHPAECRVDLPHGGL